MANAYVERVLKDLNEKYPEQPLFIQAATEILNSLGLLFDKDPKYEEAKILERFVEPERIIMFKVPWTDDKGELQVNRGWRVEFNSAIGAYKGGLRFAANCDLGMLKFLGLEQILKNSLTTLPMGGGKGGSDFDPNGKSDNEIMHYCQSFMTELFRHIGPNTDIPAGDQGVGGREIGYLFGQYKRLTNEFTGTLTGKGRSFGGSLARPEATGFGVVYFAQNMLATKNDSFKGKKVAISGFGNVAWGAVQKATDLGGTVVTISGPDGYIYDADGVGSTQEKVDYMLEMRASGRNKVQDYADKFGVDFIAGKRPWEAKVDVCIPCATQNELEADDARTIVKNGAMCVAEASNMASSLEAIHIIQEGGLLFSPGKASNAGGVAVSGLEQSQNAMKYSWTYEEVDGKLQQIMKGIHDACVTAAEEVGTPGNYVNGANIAGFLKVAEAMMAQGSAL